MAQLSPENLFSNEERRKMPSLVESFFAATTRMDQIVSGHCFMTKFVMRVKAFIISFKFTKNIQLIQLI